MTICNTYRHEEIVFDGLRCPLCSAIEAYDEALGRAEHERTQLEGAIADLEERLQGYKDELGV